MFSELPSMPPATADRIKCRIPKCNPWLFTTRFIQYIGVAGMSSGLTLYVDGSGDPKHIALSFSIAGAILFALSRAGEEWYNQSFATPRPFQQAYQDAQYNPAIESLLPDTHTPG